MKCQFLSKPTGKARPEPPIHSIQPAPNGQRKLWRPHSRVRDFFLTSGCISDTPQNTFQLTRAISRTIFPSVCTSSCRRLTTLLIHTPKKSPPPKKKKHPPRPWRPRDSSGLGLPAPGHLAALRAITGREQRLFGALLVPLQRLGQTVRRSDGQTVRRSDGQLGSDESNAVSFRVASGFRRPVGVAATERHVAVGQKQAHNMEP